MKNQINNIFTKRNYQKWPSYQVVYEWEDIFADKLNLRFIEQTRFKKLLLKILFNSKTKLDSDLTFIHKKGNYVIAFVMNLEEMKDFGFSRINLVPIFIDVWFKDINRLLKIAHKFPVFFVTSLEIFNLLSKIISNVVFIPLSISDKWDTRIICAKDIDVIQMGRKNQKLHDFMLQVVKEHPEIEYVYQEMRDKALCYVSTKRGDLGNFQQRDDCMKLLSRAKISLVSSPGIDNSRDTGGINPVTPRFFESAVNYCHMIGRYPVNEDFQYCNIKDICNNVLTFKEFVKYIFSFLNSGFCVDKKYIYDEFLNKNVTSKRVGFVEHVIKSL